LKEARDLIGEDDPRGTWEWMREDICVAGWRKERRNIF